MTSATPKPRAGEHVMESGGAHPAIVRELQESVIALRAERDTLRAQRNKAWDERDSLRERERELVEALKAVVEWVVLNKPRTYPSGDWGAYPPDCIEQARAALAKHGR